MEKIKQVLGFVVHVALLAFKVAKKVLKIVVQELIVLLQKLDTLLGE
jgi:hypothetical protein